MSDDSGLPPWHPAVVPGEAWSDHWRRQRQANRERYQDELGRPSPDPRLVEPQKFPD